MGLSHFLKGTDFFNKSEIEKVKIISYYLSINDSNFEFNVDDMAELFKKLGLHTPNKSRLKKNINSSRDFIKGYKKDHFRLHANVISGMREKYKAIDYYSEIIETMNSILPESLDKDTRSYIESLAKQINASYENNIFDGCAVLMRRLLEILLIHSFESLGIESEIKNSSGEYFMLSEIIKNAKINSTLSLSRNTKECLDDFRTLGNFSAHKVYYTAKRQ